MRRAFRPSVEGCERRDLPSGLLAGMYISGGMRALTGPPSYDVWVGGQIIYSPVGGSGLEAAGEAFVYGYSGSFPLYAGYLDVQNTKAEISFQGPLGGLMNYQGTVQPKYGGQRSFVMNPNGTMSTGTVSASWAFGNGGSDCTFNFDAPRHLPPPLHHRVLPLEAVLAHHRLSAHVGGLRP
jgi:hypothetical protein